MCPTITCECRAHRAPAAAQPGGRISTVCTLNSIEESRRNKGAAQNSAAGRLHVAGCSAQQERQNDHREPGNLDLKTHLKLRNKVLYKNYDQKNCDKNPAILRVQGLQPSAGIWERKLGVNSEQRALPAPKISLRKIVENRRLLENSKFSENSSEKVRTPCAQRMHVHMCV